MKDSQLIQRTGHSPSKDKGLFESQGHKHVSQASWLGVLSPCGEAVSRQSCMALKSES